MVSSDLPSSVRIVEVHWHTQFTCIYFTWALTGWTERWVAEWEDCRAHQCQSWIYFQADRSRTNTCGGWSSDIFSLSSLTTILFRLQLSSVPSGCLKWLTTGRTSSYENQMKLPPTSAAGKCWAPCPRWGRAVSPSPSSLPTSRCHDYKISPVFCLSLSSSMIPGLPSCRGVRRYGGGNLWCCQRGF